MNSPIIVRSSDEHDMILGMINESTGQNLKTGKRPFCAVTVNECHGFKREYFATALDALNFIYEENKVKA